MPIASSRAASSHRRLASRVIDDAAVGGQSDRSADSNKLVLCTPLRPAQQAAAMLAHVPPNERRLIAQCSRAVRTSPMPTGTAPCPWMRPGHVWLSDITRTGMPLHSSFIQACFLACRWLLPASTATVVSWMLLSVIWCLSSRACTSTTAIWLTGQAARGQFSGRPVSWQKCWERRLPKRAAGYGVIRYLSWSGPRSLRGADLGICALLGPGAPPRQDAGPDTPGACCGSASARPRRQDLWPHEFPGARNLWASRLRWASFPQQAAARAGVQASAEIRKSFELILAVLATRPQRRFWLSRPVPSLHRSVGCGRGLRQEGGEECQVREGFVAVVTPRLYSLWTPGDKKIAQLELSMLLYALVARPSHFRHRRGVWWIDNTAALMALIRGRSDSPDLSRLAQIIHVGLFCLNTWIYFEWVPSKSNWSDAIGREGEADSWHQDHGFSTSFCFFPHELWDLPFRALIATFEFL